MPHVTLVDYTGKSRSDELWHAADVMLFTKSTRLEMSPGLFDEIKAWPPEKKRKELDYMSTTIPSSWEFVDVTFLIEGVTRACAQQITRTRTASYAMQSQRVVDAAAIPVTNPFPAESPLHELFDDHARKASELYASLRRAGAEPQDARALLPMNVQCNLVAKYNLRSFVDLIAARSSLRVQGEYAEIAQQMHAAVLQAWPWARVFFRPKYEAAIKLLEDAALGVGIDVGQGAGWQIAKAIDLLRKV